MLAVRSWSITACKQICSVSNEMLLYFSTYKCDVAVTHQLPEASLDIFMTIFMVIVEKRCSNLNFLSKLRTTEHMFRDEL